MGPVLSVLFTMACALWIHIKCCNIFLLHRVNGYYKVTYINKYILNLYIVILLTLLLMKCDYEK